MIATVNMVQKCLKYGNCPLFKKDNIFILCIYQLGNELCYKVTILDFFETKCKNSLFNIKNLIHIKNLI